MVACLAWPTPAGLSPGEARSAQDLALRAARVRVLLSPEQDEGNGAMNKALHSRDADVRAAQSHHDGAAWSHSDVSTWSHRGDWRKQMSDNVAYGLLVYTGLQIFVTMHEIQGTSASILPLFALVVLVAAIIPMFRQFERRWEHLTDEQAHDLAYKAAFRRDQIRVWLLAAVLPFVITGAFRVLSVLF